MFEQFINLRGSPYEVKSMAGRGYKRGASGSSDRVAKPLGDFDSSHSSKRQRVSALPSAPVVARSTIGTAPSGGHAYVAMPDHCERFVLWVFWARRRRPR